MPRKLPAPRRATPLLPWPGLRRQREFRRRSLCPRARSRGQGGAVARLRSAGLFRAGNLRRGMGAVHAGQRGVWLVQPQLRHQSLSDRGQEDGFAGASRAVSSRHARAAFPTGLWLSVGDGCTIGGVWKGLREMHRLGLLPRLPRILGVQADGCQPFVTAWRERSGLTPCEANTLADSIAVGHPRNFTKGMRAVTESGGAFVAVSDEEILAVDHYAGAQGRRVWRAGGRGRRGRRTSGPWSRASSATAKASR